MKKLFNDPKDFRAATTHHLSATVGGFFAVYAVMMRGNLGSAVTGNFINLVTDCLSGDLLMTIIRLGGGIMFALGVATATLLPKFWKVNYKYVALGFDLLACLICAFIPEEVSPILALYPIFFVTASHWVAFGSAAGFNSAPIFSTNNTRQCIAGLCEYIYSREEKYWRQFAYFGGSILSFHAGIAFAWFFVSRWGIPAIYANLLLIGATAAATIRESKCERY